MMPNTKKILNSMLSCLVCLLASSCKKDNLVGLEITQISALKDTVGATIRIKGRNFSQDLSEVVVYEPSSNSWRSKNSVTGYLIGDAPVAKSAVLLKGKAYIIDYSRDALLIYDLQKDSWSKGANYTTVTTRMRTGALYTDDKYVYFGMGDHPYLGFHPVIYKYDQVNNLWNIYDQALGPGQALLKSPFYYNYSLYQCYGDYGNLYGDILDRFSIDHLEDKTFGSEPYPASFQMGSSGYIIGYSNVDVQTLKIWTVDLDAYR